MQQAALLERGHDPTRRRRRPTDPLGEIGDGQRLHAVDGVERGELGKAELQLGKVGGKANNEVAPQRTAHCDPVGKQARVLELVARGRDRGAELAVVARVLVHPCIIAPN